MKLLRLAVLFSFATLIGFVGNAQIFFTENFEGTPGPNGLPTTWTESGLSTDGIWSMGDATAASSAYVTIPAAIQGTNFAYTNDDACDCDKSEDRMILPAQDFSTYAGVELIFDVFNPGTYSGVGTVEISTDGGVTWTPVYTMLTDGAAWQDDIAVNISAYSGTGFTNVLVAFRFNDSGAWSSALAIDEVRLNELTVVNPDMTVVGLDLYEYTIVPLSQVTPIALSGTVTNIGAADAPDAMLTVNVYDATNLVTPIQTTTSPTAAVVIGASTNLAAGTYTPTVEATYVFEYITSATGDNNAANDTAYASVLVNDNEFARDDSNITFNAGIGAGPSGYLGTKFTLVNPAQIDSVLGAFQKPGTSNAPGDGVGDSTRYVIYDLDVSGLPNAIIGTSPTYVFTAADTGVLIVEQLPIEAIGGGVLNLPAGEFFVAAEENQTNVGLAFTDNIFNTTTHYFSWTGQPWTPAENFPVQFQRVPVLRPIINCATTGTDVLTACDSLTWIDGITYTSSNNTATFVLSNVQGCDSTVTLDLTINTSDAVTDVQQACDSLVWIDGNTYTTSNNTATFTLQNVAGCDSVVTLDLTISTTITQTDVLSSCDSLTWIDGQTYTASNNTATFTLPGAGACDTLVTLDLTITATPGDGVTQTGTTLSADETAAGVTYQWVDCDNGNAPIAGETNQTFTPTVTGNYAVIVTNNGCTSTSACTLVDFTGLATLYSESLKLYPNPSEDVLSVEGIQAIPDLTSIKVTSLNGKELINLDVNDDSFDVSALTSGMYFFVIEYGEGQKEAIKFMKK